MTEFKPIYWGPLFAGAFVGVGLNFLTNLGAFALGLSSHAITMNGITEFSPLGYLIFCISALISMFITGWIAGQLSPRRSTSSCWGLLWGFIAWALLLIITIILITNMIQFANFHANFTSNLVEIRLKNNAPMLTGTITDFSKNAPLNIYSEDSKKIIVVNAFLTFILFLIGALASCLGGFMGYKKTNVLKE